MGSAPGMDEVRLDLLYDTIAMKNPNPVYIIVSATTKEGLAEKVNVKLQEGYQCQGGVCSSDSDIDRSYNVLFQSMLLQPQYRGRKTT